MELLSAIDGPLNVRGKGLMIGFDLPDELSALRGNLLTKHHIFTGEAKPNVVRLLPALNVRQEEIAVFVEALKEEIVQLRADAKDAGKGVPA